DPDISVLFSFSPSPTTVIYTLSLHDALPIYFVKPVSVSAPDRFASCIFPCFIISLLGRRMAVHPPGPGLVSGSDQTFNLGVYYRSEEHTSELQSRSDIVCRLLLVKKNQPERP